MFGQRSEVGTVDGQHARAAQDCFRWRKAPSLGIVARVSRAQSNSRCTRWSFALVCILLALVWPSIASAYKLRIRGGTIIDGHARFTESGLELAGQLSDDGRTAISGASIRVRSKDGVVLAEPSACTGRLAPTIERGATSIQTDAAGGFCVLWPRAAAVGRLVLAFAGDALHAGTERELTFDRNGPQQLPTELRFDPRPGTLDVDRQEFAVSGVLTVGTRGDAAPARAGLPVELLGDAHERLATAKTSGDGRVAFVLPTDRLGSPGLGALELLFSGTDALSADRDVQPVLRRAAVSLELGAPVEPADPTSGARLVVDVRSARGTVADGIVEVIRDGQSVGSGEVREGRADVVATFDPGRQRRPEVVLRYLPQSPWWRAGRPLVIAFAVAPPSVGLHVVLSVIVVVAAAWVAISWRRARKPPLDEQLPPILAPGVHVVATRQGVDGWAGIVCDAHDGAPIALARVRVLVPALAAQADVRSEVVTDDRGRFALDGSAVPREERGQARIVVTARDHSREHKPLPPPGELRVALVTRRRAVLARLVAWAQRRGAPFDVKPEPTPLQIRQGAPGAVEIESWARDVEKAAFGADPVDEELEMRLQRSEPRGAEPAASASPRGAHFARPDL